MLEPTLSRRLRGAVTRATANIDIAAVRVTLALMRTKPRRLRDIASRREMYASMAERYAAIDPAEFYAPPFLPAGMTEQHVRAQGDATVVDLAWPSEYVTHLPEYRAAYRAYPANGTVHVRLFRVRRDAPTIVFVHGYRAGPFPVEERMWPIPALLARGVNVALFTLPFHGRRMPQPFVRAPIFPSQGNVARTNEGFGQAIADLRSLLAWLREEGSPIVGAAGMSLGGYVVALLATVERSLDFGALYLPLADFTEAVLAHDRMRGIHEGDALAELSRAALNIHRPLARAPVVPGDRMLVLAAEGDRITGQWHAEALARHFGARTQTFPGGHLLPVARDEAFRELIALLGHVGAIQRGGTLAPPPLRTLVCDGSPPDTAS